MKPGEFQIIPPDRRKHLDEMSDLMAKVFSDVGYFEFRNQCLECYVNHSHYDWHASRIGILDGRIVTHYGVWGYDMRIGSAVVRVGGIGGVATHADFRKRGFMARTIRASLDAMRENAYDMTILFGINDFYHRFGYIRAWSDTDYVVAVRDLPAERPSVKPRKFRSFLREDVTAIYNREHARLTGSAVRPTYLSNKRKWKDWESYLWTGAGGRTSGYVAVAHREPALHCFETAGDVEQTLRVIAMLARRRSCTEVRFSSPHYDGPLARRLRRGTCRTETRYRRCGGAMIHTVHLASTLSKMSGELSRRLRNSPLAPWRGNLLIADAREQVLLVIDRSRVHVAAVRKTKHAIRGGEEIAQLLIGSDEPEEIVEASGTRLSGDAHALIRVLFPNQHPQLRTWDRY